MLDLYNHHPPEDTTTTALLVLGVLKAAAVLKVVRQIFNSYPLAFYSPLVGRLFQFKFVVIDTLSHPSIPSLWFYSLVADNKRIQRSLYRYMY